VAPNLRVAICTSRTAGQAREAIEAVAAQVPSERFALVTSGLGEAAVSAHLQAFPGVHLAEPRPGLSRARNRALDWADDSDVLAFVDDDAVVDAGWYEALSSAWRGAAASVGCIGGPIRPRFAGDPPAWLSDPLLPVLTLLDFGDEPLDLDPDTTTVYGANISFRVGPLRDAGGFDPAFGHSDGRVFFSEEDEAQRALSDLGYGTRYDPAPGVRHVIPAERLRPGAFLRRRFAYGATLGVRGARPRGVAARQALRSAVGLLPAAVSGDSRRLMERAVRAAENAGVLAAPLVRR
jgi:glycosyltransferase involved in cell wall biosynthesis